ncbi:CCR4-NOT transcription complex subunit 10-like isoform X2 [Papaver somniferum]|uniref:CCR4-NOT transcription complex subunit 10-like isoform X2 n=1 Tax=Papaver somniferum TaxID=3469 RepID=UPI000E6F5DE2|nr:CCR4-NOT transcription complex subunit 10-like isoform X2 [Papaver somniferum]
MDSSSSTTSAATVIASAAAATSGDEDGLITVRSGLAKDAVLLFQSRRYSDCLEVLNQLNKKKQDDPKVLHNIAVAEYFNGGCTDPRKLLEVLNNVKRSEELAHAAGEQVDASSIGNNSISGPKSHQFSAATTASAYTDEFDTSVAKLNIAVVLFHLHEYANALSILEPLYHNIEPLDEATALHICLLLLDIALASNNATRAAHVIQYLEKTFTDIIGQGDSGNVAHHQSANTPAKTSSAPSNSPALDTSNSDPIVSANISEAPLGRSLSEESDSYETLLSTLDIGGQNLARAPGFTINNDLSRTTTDRAAPVVDLKLKLHLYRVRLLLLTRNLKASKREVKLAVNIARGSDSSMALLLKSQLEYARGNHRKAIKLLMASNSRTEPWMESMFHNNLGCIHHQLKKHHMSTCYFSRALKSNSSLRSEKPQKLLTFSQDRSLSVVYNCGLQYLACSKPAAAARCFEKASLIFYNKPLLWLRIAECCLLALEKGLLNSSEVRVQVIGTGKWRQLLVEDGTSRNRFLELTKLKNGSLGSADKVDLSISFGRQCLLNALHLLDGLELKSQKTGSSALKEDETNEETPLHSSNHKNLAGRDSKASNIPASNANGDVKDSKGGGSCSSILQSSISLYEDICRRENNMIKQAVLADLAYVELNLENPLKALMAANSLLRLPDCSRIYIFLGHVYAAEALCHLNRPKEASEHLVAYVDGSQNSELPYSEEDREKLGVGKGGDIEEINGGSVPPKIVPKEEYQGTLFLKPEEARGSLYVNLAAISAVQGDLEQAHRFAREALSMIPRNSQAILTSVYVDLLLGKTEDAVSKLNQFDGVRFLSTAVRSGS